MSCALKTLAVTLAALMCATTAALAAPSAADSSLETSTTVTDVDHSTTMLERRSGDYHNYGQQCYWSLTNQYYDSGSWVYCPEGETCPYDVCQCWFGSMRFCHDREYSSHYNNESGCYYEREWYNYGDYVVIAKYGRVLCYTDGNLYYQQHGRWYMFNNY